MTAYELEAELRTSIKGIKELVFDMAKLAYISKVMNKQGSMTVKNANSDIRNIFAVTGFDEILNIE